jgi:hypothetical protein
MLRKVFERLLLNLYYVIRSLNMGQVLKHAVFLSGSRSHTKLQDKTVIQSRSLCLVVKSLPKSFEIINCGRLNNLKSWIWEKNFYTFLSRRRLRVTFKCLGGIKMLNLYEV